MQLSNDWHKRTNVRLVDILSDILKELRPPKVPKPTHGYTIAEKAPEVVTAPGVYFPAEKGKVIPLESRQSGGAVTPTRTLQQMLEKLASYAPFPIPGAAGQSTTARQRVEGQGENRFETAIATEPKQPPLVSRQDGGEVDPNLFKETFSVNSGDPTQQGIEAAANTASMKSTPINVSPLTPSLQSYAPGANLTPTGPLTPPTGMAEYEESARRMKGSSKSTTPSPTLQGSQLSNVASLQSYAPSEAKPEGSILTNPLTPSPPVNPTNKRLNQITGFLRSFMKPPVFKENRRSPIFGSDQKAAYDKKWKPYTDFMEGTKETPLFSRAPGGATSPDPLEGLSEEERKKLYEGLKTEFPIESLAPSHEPSNQTSSVPPIGAREGEQTVVPKVEPAKQAKVGIPGSLSEIKKDLLPSGQTRYTLPGTEETATVGPERFFVKNKEVPAGTPGAVSGDELARQRIFNEASRKSPELEAMNRWQTPGYKEAQLAKAQKEGGMISIKGGPPMPSVIDVSPGYEKTWEEAHPENVKAGTPHLVQNASGGYDLIYPSGTPGEKAAVSPTGVIGKTPPQDTSEWRTHEKAGQEKGWTRDQILADWDRKQIERTGKKAEVTMNVQTGGATSFPNWDEGTKRQSFENFIINNQKPTFAWRDAKSRNAWEEEYNKYLIEKGKTAESVGETRFYRGAQKKALDNNEVYRVAAERFVNVIDQNVELVKKLKKQYGVDYGRIVNVAINNINQGIPGSGDLMSLQQALTSLSNEVAKVESGSMGIAEVSVEQAKIWKKIHDYNLNESDLDKVLDTSKQLGEIRRRSLRETTDALRKGLGESEVRPGETPKPSEGTNRPRASDFGGNPPASGEERKTVGGKSYIKRSGKWYEE